MLELHGYHWWQGPVICSVCSFRHTAVMPIPMSHSQPDEAMECPECGSMSCVVAIDEVDE